MWPNIGATYTNSTNMERFLIVQVVQTPAENCLKSGKPLKFLDFDLRQAVLLWECSAQLIWGKWEVYFFGPIKIMVLILVRLKKFKSSCYDERRWCTISNCPSGRGGLSRLFLNDPIFGETPQKNLHTSNAFQFSVDYWCQFWQEHWFLNDKRNIHTAAKVYLYQL